MGKSNQAKRRAKKAAKRRQAKRGGTGAGVGRAPHRDRVPDAGGQGVWAATPELQTQWASLVRDTSTSFQAFRTALDHELFLDACGQEPFPLIAGMMLDLCDLRNELRSLDLFELYALLGMPAWSARYQRARQVAMEPLPKRLRACLPDLKRPSGWLGCWTVRKGWGEDPPRIVDWLTPGRPEPGQETGMAPWTLSQAARRALRGPWRPRQEEPAVDPCVFMPQWDLREDDGDRHFVGWRVERDGIVSFFTLLEVGLGHLRSVVETFRETMALGRIRTAADWDGLLVAMATAIRGAQVGRTRSPWLWEDDVSDAFYRAWLQDVVPPVQVLQNARRLSDLGLSYELFDPANEEGEFELREAAEAALSISLMGEFLDAPGPFYGLCSTLDLLPVRFATAGADGASAHGSPGPEGEPGDRAQEDATEAVEEVLDGLRETLRRALAPYLEPTRPLLRTLWDRSFLALALSMSMPGIDRLAAWDEGTVRRQPLAWLGLGPDHPAVRALGPLATVGAGLRWSQEAAQRPAGEGDREAGLALREAYEVARAEARLCEVLGPPPEDVRSRELQAHLWMRTISLGWRGVFDPRAGAAPVASLDFPKRGRARILEALGADPGQPEGAPGGGPTVVDVPEELGALLVLPGIGPKSAVLILKALWKHATSWRDAFVPADAARAAVRAPAPAREEAKVTLSQGLDALAELFGDADPSGGEDG